YLISQLTLSNEERMEDLRQFVPNAKSENWEMVVAGQRVQVIKDTDKGKGTLQLGTEVITSEDGSLAALLGASQGASTAVDIMLDVLQRCYKQQFNIWEEKDKEIVPAFIMILVKNQAI